MDTKDFMEFSDSLKQYLETEKNYIPNIARLNDVSDAIKLALDLYPEHKVIIAKDPLQMGSLFIDITGPDISAIGEREIELFNQLVSKANNFETVPVGNEELRLSICFADAFQVILK